MLPQRKCEQCRLSDNACDLQRPKCSGCVAKSAACIYPAVNATFTFVNQNQAAAVASRRAAYRRSREIRRRITVTLDTSLLEIAGNTTTRKQEPSQLPAPILHTLDDRVVQRFVSRWAAGQTCLGCLDSMPDLLEASGGDSAVRTAILATAYADLSVYERHGDRGTKSYQAYAGTLRRLQDELSEPNFVASNAILAAVLAIDVFELLFMGRTDPLGVHTKAIVRLLELLKDSYTQSYHLWRSAYQRIRVRQLFCDMGPLPSGGLILEDDSRPEVRTIKFVADSCDVMSQIKKERHMPAGRAKRENLTNLCAMLRSLMQQAHEWSENNASLPRPRRIPFNIHSDPESGRVFPNSTIIVYDNSSVARDRLLFNTCSIKILDTLLEIHTQDFSSRRSGYSDVDRARDFLLAAQLDLAALRENCRFVLDVVPFFIGLVDSNGIIKVDPWTINDTGVLTLMSPLKTVERCEFVLPDTRIEAKSILNFFGAHRHVVQQA